MSQLALQFSYRMHETKTVETINYKQRRAIAKPAGYGKLSAVNRYINLNNAALYT